jgi:hypothetical protein
LLGLEHIELGRHAVSYAQFGQLDGILLSVDRAPRDLDLQVEIKERKVVTRHVTHQCEDNRLLSIFGDEKLGACRFGSPPQAAEEIQLEGGVSGEHQEVRFRLKVVLLATRGVGIALDLRELIRARDAKLCSRCLDALRRRLEIVILFQRRADEALQLRILKHLPPGQIGV